MLIALLHFFTDDENPQGIVSSLVDALPSGSYLTITNLTADFMDPDQAARATRRGSRAASPTCRAARRRSPPSSAAST